MEEYRDIKGYEGIYQVSNYGRVKSLSRKALNGRTVKERILKQNIGDVGYYNVTLCKDGNHQTFRVHRLVAEAFLPNNNNHPYINHKDENKLNNNVDNLEWCTETYNQVYSNGKQVLKYDDFGNLLAVYHSNREAATANNVSIGTISKWCKKSNNWKYAET